ncbi:hypothetical protein FQA47_018827 [Oryzias melastigma]|uniref:Uncharacterized protein n=1 Tax=Oryzias melastigma TaxID=30732 RepID=A0A834CDC1_ORYME|nr:hypothetical protein FQA47_018827 [Oryzias melastigma]
MSVQLSPSLAALNISTEGKNRALSTFPHFTPFAGRRHRAPPWRKLLRLPACLPRAEKSQSIWLTNPPCRGVVIVLQIHPLPSLLSPRDLNRRANSRGA